MSVNYSFRESILYYSVKLFGRLMRLLPLRAALTVGRFMGAVIFYIDNRHRDIVLGNLKTAFADQKSFRQIKQIARSVFQKYGQNFIELLRMPDMNTDVFQRYVRLDGQQHVERAMKKGKGIILLAMHYGSWELANLASAMMGYPYKVIVNPQKRYNRLDLLLNSYRECGGTVTLQKGLGTRDFIRSLKNNEIVAMVMDQGGKDGIKVPFFNRQASMSAGAIRMALKMDVPVCFAVILRERGPYHRIVIHEELTLQRSGNTQEDIQRNISQIVRLMERYIRDQPDDYMWFYKIWKYSADKVLVILHDGRTGHLRQSQAVVRILEQNLAGRGGEVTTQVVPILYRSPLAATVFNGLAALGRFRFMISPLLCLSRLFLTADSFNALMLIRADYIVSCGSRAAMMNHLLSAHQAADNITVQRPGLLPLRCFRLAVLPEHDRQPKRSCDPSAVAITLGAPNLITPEYLTQQRELLLNRFSHLKTRDCRRIGLLVGGDTKEFVLQQKRLRLVVHQLTEVAEEINADILATTSRRTSVDIENMLQRELKRHGRCPLLIIANRNNVPEAVGGILGLADIIVVSGDSISMISEAASSGKQTIVFKPWISSFSRQRKKHEHFIEKLNARGYVLSSDVSNLKKSVYAMAKNKIQTVRLDDNHQIDAALKKII